MSQIRLFHTVAQQILQLIADEGFGPGAKLPGERELAERFGVSRVTVREAEVALQAQGRLTIKTGSGVFVSAGPAVSEMSPTELRAALSDVLRAVREVSR